MLILSGNIFLNCLMLDAVVRYVHLVLLLLSYCFAAVAADWGMSAGAECRCAGQRRVRMFELERGNMVGLCEGC